MRRPSPAEWRQANVDAVRASAGIANQDNTCPHGTPGCPGPNCPSSALPCSQCFLGGDEADA